MSEELKTNNAEKVEFIEPAKAEATAPEKPRKTEKKGKGGKIVLSIVGVLLAIVVIVLVGAIVLFGMATADNMPAAPSATDVDMQTFAVEAAQEVLSENTITIESADIDMILGEVKASVNSSTDIIRIDDLFCVLADGSGTIYARVYVGEVDVKGTKLNINKTIPVQAGFEIGFDDETKEIIVILGDVRCGAIKIPQSLIDTGLNAVQLPEEMRVKNGNIYYDTTGLDTMIDEMLSSLIANAINESSISSFLGGILGDDNASSLLGSVTEAVTGAAANATDVQISGARIAGSELIIDGQVL